MNVKLFQKHLVLFIMMVSTVIPGKQSYSQRYAVTQVYGGQGTANGKFNNPYSIIEDTSGNLWISDAFNHRIQKLSLDGTHIQSFGTLGSGIGQFNQPHGLAFDTSGNLYVADRNNNRIQVFDNNGNFLRQWGSSGTGPGQFDLPRTIRIDTRAGIVFVGDDAGRRIQQFSLTGTYIKGFGGFGTSSNQFQLLAGFQLDNLGNIWAVDRQAAEVRKYDRNGNLLFKFGSHGVGKGQFDYPSFIDIDSAGFLYVHEGAGTISGHPNRIQKFTAKGEYVSELTDNSTSQSSTFLPGEFTIRKNGEVLVSDYGPGNQRVLRFKPQWPKYSYFKSFGSGEFGADSPAFMDVDAVGNTYVADRWNQRVKVFDSNGTLIRTIPTGVTTDYLKVRDGMLYVSGYWTHVLVFNLQGQYIKTIGSGLVDVDGVDILDGIAHMSSRDVIYRFDVTTNALLGSLRLPSSLRIFQLNILQNGNYFVSDPEKPNVSIFSPSGDLVWTLPDCDFMPSMSLDGRLVVPLLNPKRVQILDPYGAITDEFAAPASGAVIAADGTLFVMDAISRKIDIYKPVSDLVSPTSSFTPTPSTAWSNTDVSATITATDNTGGSGVKEIHYSVNMGTEQVVTGSSASFTLTENGTHSIAYYAVDNAGNTETTKYATVRIDKIAPTSAVSRSNGMLTLAASDTHSGVAKSYFKVNGGLTYEYLSPLPDAIDFISFWSVDNAGNIEAVKTIWLRSQLASININPQCIVGGPTLLATLTLTTFTGTPTTITLQSDNPNVVVPASVTIDAGQTSKTFTIETKPVGAYTQTNITANLGTQTRTAQLDLLPPTAKIRISPPVVSSESTAKATITLSGNAPIGGLKVDLESDETAASVPSSITVPEGQKTATFNITTGKVTEETYAYITATVDGVSSEASLTIRPKTIKPTSLSITESLVGGANGTGTITLSDSAPEGGLDVDLATNNAAVSLPLVVNVAAGSKTANFTFGTSAVSSTITATVSAKANGATVTDTIEVRVRPLGTLVASPSTLPGKATGTLTLTLSSPTSTPLTVNVTSSNAAVVLASKTITIAKGQSQGIVKFTTAIVGTDTTSTITCSANGLEAKTDITVQSAKPSNVTLLPAVVPGGKGSIGTVTIDSAAPTSGLTVALSSSDSSAVVPSFVLVPSGKTTATFTITTSKVTASKNVTITASANGVSKTATLGVRILTIASISFNPGSVEGGVKANALLTLTDVAPLGGMTVTLGSDKAGVTVPTSVVVPAGKSTVAFVASTSVTGSSYDATITGTANGETGSGTLKVLAPAVSSFTLSSTSVKGGDKPLGTVKIAKASSVDVVVSLSSSNAAIASLPATVTIPKGQLLATFQVTTTKPTTATSVTLSATTGGLGKTLVVTVSP